MTTRRDITGMAIGASIGALLVAAYMHNPNPMNNISYTTDSQAELNSLAMAAQRAGMCVQGRLINSALDELPLYRLEGCQHEELGCPVEPAYRVGLCLDPVELGQKVPAYIEDISGNYIDPLLLPD